MKPPPDDIGGLVISLKMGEKVYIDHGKVIIQYSSRHGDRIKLKFKADPKAVKIDRLSPACTDEAKH